MKLDLQYFGEETTQSETNSIPPAARILYSDKEIAALHSGQSATLHCAGLRAQSDLVIQFTVGGEVRYDAATVVGEAKKATLHCAGKRMTQDVVISVRDGYDTEMNALGSTIIIRGFTAIPNENGLTVQIL